MTAPIRGGLLSIAGLVFVACQQRDQETKPQARIQTAPAAPPMIVVEAATQPVAWLGCQLVGAPCIEVALVPPGASAHSWEPKPSDVKGLSAATVYVRTSLSFEESWVPRFQSAVPDLPIVDLRGSFDLLDHEEGHPHRGAVEADPHVWSSPRAMALLADSLAAHWKARAPGLAGRIDSGLPRLRRRLLALDTLARNRLAPFSGKTFYVNHPGLGYLARDYGLVQRALESHGQEVTPLLLWEIRKSARGQAVRAIFAQKENSRRVAEQVASELSVPVVDIDLLEGTNYDSVFRVALDSLAGHL